MKRVTDEYCNAYESADFSYLPAHTNPKTPAPEAEFLKNTLFNWATQGPSTHQFDISTPEGSITGTMIPFEETLVENYEVDEEPGIALLESPDRIDGVVTFRLNGFSFGIMQEFADEFRTFIRALLTHPGTPVVDLAVRRPR